MITSPPHAVQCHGRCENWRQCGACWQRRLMQLRLFVAGDAKRWTALHWAIWATRDSLDILRLLLDVNPCLAAACDVHGYTPAHYAGMGERMDVMRMLVSAAPSAAALAATPDCVGRYLLHYAARSSEPDLVWQLLELAPACVAAEFDLGFTLLDLLLRRGSVCKRLDAKRMKLPAC